MALAAVNAPGSVVVSGDEDAVLELQAAWDERGARTKRLRVSHAFHSPRMEGMLEEFRQVAETVAFSEPRDAGGLEPHRARWGARRSCAHRSTGCATCASRCGSPTACGGCARRA